MERKLIGGLSCLVHEASFHSPVIVFIHGMWEGAWLFENWMKKALELGFSSVAIDLPGHHGSPTIGDVGSFTIEEYASRVADVVRSVRKKVVLVGHSMGGLIAMKVAEFGLENVKHAVFLNAAPPKGIFLRGSVLIRMLRPSYIWAIALGKPLMASWEDTLFLELNRVANPEEIYAKMVPESGTAARDIVLWNVSVDPKLFRCGTTVIGSTEDRIIPARVERKIAQRLGSEYLEFDGGHMLPIEPNSEIVIREIAERVKYV